MKANQIAEQLDITLLRLIDEMFKHFGKCLMMDAHRNEEQQRCAIEKHISMAACNGNTYFGQIPSWRRLIPRQTEMDCFFFNISHTVRWSIPNERKERVFIVVHIFSRTIKVIRIEIILDPIAIDHRKYRCIDDTNDGQCNILEIKCPHPFACVICLNQIPKFICVNCSLNFNFFLSITKFFRILLTAMVNGRQG